MTTDNNTDIQISGDNPESTQNTAVRPDWLPEKFWDATAGQPRYEQLAKSYAELERSRSTPSQPSNQPGTQAQAADAAAAEAVSQAGLNWETVTKEFNDTGSLSEETLSALEKGGIPRAIAEDYMSAAKAANTARKAETAMYLALNHGDGNDGPQMLQELLAWAGANLLPAQVQTYNQMLASDTEWKAAIDSLAVKYKAANPLKQEGSQVLPTGNPGAGGSSGAAGFASLAEQNAAISDPRYKTDAAYRNMVRQRVALTKVSV